jgi:hypothetical protein
MVTKRSKNNFKIRVKIQMFNLSKQVKITETGFHNTGENWDIPSVELGVCKNP